MYFRHHMMTVCGVAEPHVLHYTPIHALSVQYLGGVHTAPPRSWRGKLHLGIVLIKACWGRLRPEALIACVLPSIFRDVETPSPPLAPWVVTWGNLRY